MHGRLNITSRGYRFLCQCELCSLQGEQLDRDEESRRINIRRIAEINCLADNIPLELGESQQKTKYKYCCLNLIHTMEQMSMPVSSLFLVKSCIFSIYILLEERETAIIWARDLCAMSSLLTGATSEETNNWRNTADTLLSFTEDREFLEQSIQGWSLNI